MGESPEVYKVYWDSCAWIALIKREAVHLKHLPALERIYESARRGDPVEIWTSALSYVEVWEHERTDDILNQPFIRRVEFSFIIGSRARELLRAHKKLKKPYDAVHLASALRYNVDVFYTMDKKNLLPLNKKVEREDGELLRICRPSEDGQFHGELFRTKN
jgi:predicted nucleic acid-binding protein